MTKPTLQRYDDIKRAFYVLSILSFSVLALLIGALVFDSTGLWYGSYTGFSMLFVLLIVITTGLGIYLMRTTKLNSKQRPAVARMFTIEVTLAILGILVFGIPTIADWFL